MQDFDDNSDLLIAELDDAQGDAPVDSIGPARTPAQLFEQLDFDAEEIGVLTGGTAQESAQSAIHLLRPSGPDTARQHYGDFARTPTSAGIVELPEPIGPVRRIFVHEKLAAETRKLIRAWRFGVILDDAETPELDAETSLWHLVRGVKGTEQKLRAAVPTRFGAKRLSPVAYGLGITVNRQYNRENVQMRTVPAGEPPELVRDAMPGYSFYEGHPMVTIAETLGWAWLGRNKYPDGTPNGYPDAAVFAWIRGWR